MVAHVTTVTGSANGANSFNFGAITTSGATILFAYIHVSNDTPSAVTFSGSLSWNAVSGSPVDVPGAGNGKLFVYAAYSSSALSAVVFTATFTSGGFPQSSGVMSAYDGHDTGGAIGATNTGTANYSQTISASVTTTRADSLVIGGVGQTTNDTISSNANQTQNNEVGSAGGFSRTEQDRRDATSSSGASVSVGFSVAGYRLMACMTIEVMKPSGTLYTPTYTETSTLTDTLLKTPGKVRTETITHTDTFLRTISKVLTDLLAVGLGAETKYPGTTAQDGLGDFSWGSLTGLQAQGGTTTGGALNAAGAFNLISATNFGFSIPSTATVTGVIVEIGRASSQLAVIPDPRYIIDNTVKIIKAGSPVGNNKADVSNKWNVPPVYPNIQYGSESDLWGTTLTASEVNASNFGVAFTAEGDDQSGGTTSADVDYIRIKVFYSLPGGDTVLKQASRMLAESVTHTDTLIIKMIARVLSEALVLTDTFIRAGSRTLTETITHTATLLNQGGKFLLDTITHTDTFTRLLTHFTMLTDTVAHSDTFLKQVEKMLSETIAHTDTFIGKIIARVLLETTNITDTFLRNPLRTLIETVTHSDSIFNQAGKDLVEIITHTDTFIRSMVRTLLETVTHSDTFSSLTVKAYAFVETVTHSDIFTRIVGAVRAEVVTHSDTFIRVTSRLLTETATHTDSFIKTVGRMLSDTITHTDTFIKQAGKILTETIAHSETFLKQVGKVFGESIAHTDTFIKQAGKIVSETITHSDTSLKEVGKIISESITYTDTFLRNAARTLSETANHTASFIKTSSRAFSDVLSLSDTFLKTTGRVFFESLTHSDTLIFVRYLLLSDIVIVTDTFARISTILKVLTDETIISDVVSKLQAKVFQEVVSFIDHLLGNLNNQWWYVRDRNTYNTKNDTLWFTKIVQTFISKVQSQWYTKNNTDWEDPEH